MEIERVAEVRSLDGFWKPQYERTPERCRLSAYADQQACSLPRTRCLGLCGCLGGCRHVW